MDRLVQPPPDPPEAAGHTPPPPYFSGALDDAERLLKYSAEIGAEVDDHTRGSILRARAALGRGYSEEIGANLLKALTQLAANLKPVTADSLRAFHGVTRVTVRSYLRIAVVLAFIIVPVSLATFVTSAISKALREDITTANALAVKLRTELGTRSPSGQFGAAPTGASEVDVITDLQEFASTVRVINSRARKLNHFVLPRQKLPDEDLAAPEVRRARFELPVALGDPISARDTILTTYQDVRYFAQTLLTDVAVFYGAITACVLPVLYALLGTCAFLIRTFEDQMNNRTFTPSPANSARFLIAAIGGAVVGLFNNFSITDQASIPPLALAFLVGYSVDVFFAFLEGLTKAFSRTSTEHHSGLPRTADKQK